MANADISQTLVAKRAVNREHDGQSEEGMQVDVSLTSADANNTDCNRDVQVSSVCENEDEAGEKRNKTENKVLTVDIKIIGEEKEKHTRENGAKLNDVGKDDDELNGSKNGRRRGRRKQKGGRHHRKQWKPYSKLSWEEKQKRDDKDTLRATKKRDDQFASGQPMAPYNTTQFLMDQHQPSPVAKDAQHEEVRHAKDEGSGSYDSSDEYYDSPDDEDIFLAKDFSEAYEFFHAERLQELSKEELVREYVELESKNENLEKKITQMKKELRSSSEREQRRPSEESVEVAKVAEIEHELKKLTDENARILRENEFLKAAAGKLTAD